MEVKNREQGFMKEILEPKFGSWQSSEVNIDRSYESRWWRDHKKVTRKEIEGQWVKNSYTWKLSSRNKVMFWEDRWARGFNLRQKYPRIFTNSCQKDAKVENVGKWLNNRWEWVSRWRTEMFE